MSGRFQNPELIGRCRPDGIDSLSSKEFFERIRDLSLGLGALGVTAGDRVAIVSESRPEWLMADLAVLCGGAVTVPVYPTLSSPQVRYILTDAGAKAAIVSTRLQLDKIQEVRHKLPELEAVILIDGWQSSDSPSEVMDIQANIFAGMLLVPGKLLRKEVEAIDSSLDLVLQLAETFWTSKALMNQRLRDYMEHLT